MGLFKYIKEKIKEANERAEEIRRQREAEEKQKRINALKKDFEYITEMSNELGIDKQTMLMHLIYLKFCDFDKQLKTMKEYVRQLSDIDSALSSLDDTIDDLDNRIDYLSSSIGSIPDIRSDIDSLKMSIDSLNYKYFE